MYNFKLIEVCVNRNFCSKVEKTGIGYQNDCIEVLECCLWLCRCLLCFNLGSLHIRVSLEISSFYLAKTLLLRSRSLTLLISPINSLLLHMFYCFSYCSLLMTFSGLFPLCLRILRRVVKFLLFPLFRLGCFKSALYYFLLGLTFSLLILVAKICFKVGFGRNCIAVR